MKGDQIYFNPTQAFCSRFFVPPFFDMIWNLKYIRKWRQTLKIAARTFFVTSDNKSNDFNQWHYQSIIISPLFRIFDNFTCIWLYCFSEIIFIEKFITKSWIKNFMIQIKYLGNSISKFFYQRKFFISFRIQSSY